MRSIRMPTPHFAPLRLLFAVIVRLCVAGIVLSASIAVLNAPSVSAADEPDASAAARKKLQQQLTSRKSGERRDALAGLGAHPSADTAKLVVSRGLKDRDEDVRRAAEASLLAMKDSSDVCKFLVDTLNKEGRPKDGIESVAPMLRVLQASNLPEAKGGLYGYLD